MLPFIAGIAAGAAVVYAFGNRKEIQKSLGEGASKVKELAGDVKKSVSNTVECLSSKKSATEAPKEEAK
jgi:hypothetical protein